MYGASSFSHSTSTGSRRRSASWQCAISCGYAASTAANTDSSVGSSLSATTRLISVCSQSHPDRDVAGVVLLGLLDPPELRGLLGQRADRRAADRAIDLAPEIAELGLEPR